MELDVLGPLVVRIGDEQVQIRRGISRVLLSSLAMHRGEVVAFDALIDHVWHHELPAKPANALQSQIVYLRRALGGAASAPIRTRPTGYVLDVPDDAIDAGRFDRLVTRGLRLAQISSPASLVEALEVLDAALELWRGNPYDEVADRPFAGAEVARLVDRQLHATEARIDVLLGLGRPAEAAVDLAALVAEHPFRERFSEQLILALYRMGRQAEALRAYGNARSKLVEELGLEPGPRLQELERLVLDHSAELDWRPIAALGVTPPVDPSPASTNRPGPPVPPLGRDDELARLEELLERTRLLTLTGPGGVGKTTFALALAGRRAVEREVIVVDLGPVPAGGSAVAALATLLGVDVPPGRDVMGAVVDRLAEMDAVVVLDTCEHVVESASVLVARLRAHAPSVTVLATSRRPLRVAGEVAWAVPPLRLPAPDEDPADSPAVQLFLERARAVHPLLAVDGDTLEHVAAICCHLDALPLAIELAACNVDVIPPRALLDGLVAHLPALESRSGDPGDRQRTLWSTIGWSMELLDDRERDLLARLAVCVASFDADAAAAVASCADGLARARLVALVRASLVTATGDGRYRLLDTVRAYLLDRADPAVLADARRRHASHYAQVARAGFSRFQGTAQRSSLMTLRSELGNVRAALEWCFGPGGDRHLGAAMAAGMAWAWTLDGQVSEHAALLDRAERVPDLDPRVRARVLLGIGALASPRGDLARAVQACAEGAQLAREAGDRATLAHCLLVLGVAQWGLGEVEAAATTQDEGIDLFDRLHHRWGATMTRVVRARTALEQGDVGVARRLLDTALDEARALGDGHLLGLALEQHARCALLIGDGASAESAASEALVRHEANGYTEGTVASLHLLGRVHVADPVRSRAFHLRALELGVGMGHASAQCEALEALAALDADQGDVERACLLLVHAARQRERRSLGLRPGEAEAVERLRATVQRAVGPVWESTERRAPLTSLDEILGRLLA